jgi:ABC-2 type transport system ATP-binding protein
MRHLASEGRSVLVSSHLLPEMALTATELVVIGRGRLIAQSSTAEFVDGAATSTVRVRSPQILELAEILMRHGFDVQASPEGERSLVVAGTDTTRVGELAAGAGVVLHELALHRGSLEEAFMHITGHDVEYSAGDRNNSAALAATGR